MESATNDEGLRIKENMYHILLLFINEKQEGQFTKLKVTAENGKRYNLKT